MNPKQNLNLMPRIEPIQVSSATPEQQRLLASVKKSMGAVPNLIATMAHSPAVAQAYLDFSQTLSRGVLSSQTREQIILAVSEANQCEYCLAAHTALGLKAGLTQEETLAARCGQADSAKTTGALSLARKIVETRGHVSDDDLDSARAAGLSDAEISEVLGVTALSLFTNYFNHVARTEIDFPAAPKLEEYVCCA
jgi:uncharacterized peroxidase-related enzyme